MFLISILLVPTASSPSSVQSVPREPCTITLLDLKNLILKGRIYIATALRLIVLPTIFVLGLKMIGADETTLIVSLMAYATPLGLNTIVFPAAYRADTTTGASMALISHTIAVITIPIMFAIFIGA